MTLFSHPLRNLLLSPSSKFFISDIGFFFTLECPDGSFLLFIYYKLIFYL